MTANPLRIIRLITFVLIFVLAGFYAGTLLRPDTTQITPAATEVISAESPAAPNTLPEFVLPDITGKPRSISEFTDRPLLINFWATWCAPCLREMPMFETVWQERNSAHSLHIVGVAIDTVAAVAPYLEQAGVSYPILAGEDQAMEVARSFGPDFAGLPFSVFVLADRQILTTHSGELQHEQLADILSVIDAVAAGKLSVEAARKQLRY